MLLAAIVVLSGKAGGLGSTFDVSWYYLLGGLLGAVYVITALIAVSVDRRRRRRRGDDHRPADRLGRIDRLGVLGLDQSPAHATGCRRRAAAGGDVLIVR